MIRQFSAYECGKNKFGVVVSPHEMNALLKTLIVIPLTPRTPERSLPFYVPVEYSDSLWYAACDQPQVVSRFKITHDSGQTLSANEIDALSTVLRTMFCS